jgi:hypothetical protein
MVIKYFDLCNHIYYMVNIIFVGYFNICMAIHHTFDHRQVWIESKLKTIDLCYLNKGIFPGKETIQL